MRWGGYGIQNQCTGFVHVLSHSSPPPKTEYYKLLINLFHGRSSLRICPLAGPTASSTSWIRFLLFAFRPGDAKEKVQFLFQFRFNWTVSNSPRSNQNTLQNITSPPIVTTIWGKMVSPSPCTHSFKTPSNAQEWFPRESANYVSF